MDMFRATLQLPVETIEQPFIKSTSLEYIQPFLKIVGYQGLVDKVSAFFIKNLAQPWQTMFKVFNRCLTSRLTGHDQTKINVMQIFYAVINKVHVDYASLLWWYFIHYVQQKKNDYHSIKDDTPLVIVYTTGKVTIKGMLIPDDLLIVEIRDIQAYKDYKEKYGGVEVLMIQPELVESTQGMNRTPRATRKNIPDEVVQKKKIKGTLVAEETNSLRKYLKIRFKQREPSTTTPPLPIEQHMLHEDIKKLVDGDEKSTTDEFANTKKDDKTDDADDHTDHALIKTQRTGSLEIRTEKMQTPIPSPLRSPRKDLSSYKAIDQELIVFVTPTPSTSTQDHSKPTSNKCKILPRSIAKMN
ncbi:hypothetical protein Tco_1166881 [Tanacetum coccineum]